MIARRDIPCFMWWVMAFLLQPCGARSEELPPALSSGRVVVYDPLHFDLSYMPRLCEGSVKSPELIKSWIIKSGDIGGFPWNEANFGWVLYNTSESIDEQSTLPALLGHLAANPVGYLYILSHGDAEGWIAVESFPWHTSGRARLEALYNQYVEDGIEVGGRRVFFSEDDDEIKKDWAKVVCCDSHGYPDTIWWPDAPEEPWYVPDNVDWRSNCEYNTDWIGMIFVKLDVLLEKIGAQLDVVYLGSCEGTGVAQRLIDKGLVRVVVAHDSVKTVGELDEAGRLLTMQMLGGCEFDGNTSLCDDTGEQPTGWNRSVSEAAADIPWAVPTLQAPVVVPRTEVEAETRFYNAPRVVQMVVAAYDETGARHPVYQYDYSQVPPRFERVGTRQYPLQYLLDEGWRFEAAPGDQVEVRLRFSRSMSEPIDPAVRLLAETPEGAQRELLVNGTAFTWEGSRNWGLTRDGWRGLSDKLPDDWPEGTTTVALTFADRFGDDRDFCLDHDGDGRGREDENTESPCQDVNHRISVKKPEVRWLELLTSPLEKNRGSRRSGELFALGDTVEMRVAFNVEMDPSHEPTIGIVRGLDQSLQISLDGAHWEGGEDEQGKPVENSVYVGTWRIDPDQYYGRQEFRRLELGVSGATTSSGRTIENATQGEDDEPLVGLFDLARPEPEVEDRKGPVVECGMLEVKLKAEDEPSLYEEGDPIDPQMAFESLTIKIEEQSDAGWIPLLSQELSSPSSAFSTGGFKPDTNYRWWIEATDAAGNLDEVSFQEQEERLTFHQFRVAECHTTDEDVMACRDKVCKAQERECETEPWCPPPDYEAPACVTMRCEQGVCKSDSSSCDDDDDGGNSAPGNDRPDDNYDLSSLYAAWDDVQNEDPFSPVAVMEAGVFPSMFGLLYEFGQTARLVSKYLDPGELEGVSLLILPSGALRNRPAAYLGSRIEDFASAGGSVLVFSQARGEDFEALPGDIQGVGWQEDRSCQSRNLWFEENVVDHPILSALLGNPFSIPVDGHFTAMPDSSQALFKKVVNNRVAGFMYPVGAGTLAVTSSFEDFQRAIRYARQSVKALAGGDLSAAESVVRDWVTWLQDPADLPRVDPSTYTVDVQVQIENDAPGQEHAAVAKLLVRDPSRQGVELVEEVPLDLTFGQVTGVPMTIQLEPPHLNIDKYGIWHVEVELYDAEGNLIRPARDELSGRFVYPAPVGGYSFQPGQILITVTTTAQEIPSDAVAHYDTLLENQSDETRDLRVDVVELHRNYPTQQFLVTLDPGETWSHSLDLPRPQGQSSVHIEYRVFDQHTDAWVVRGGKRVYFLNFPIALDLLEDRTEVLPGSIQSLTVRYENLVATPMSGTLGLTLEGNQLLSVPVDLDPNSGGSIETWIQIPADTPVGTDLSVQGSFTDSASVVRGRLYGQLLVRSDISDVSFWVELVARTYMRGDTAIFDLVFENQSEQYRQVDCVLDWPAGTIWSGTVSMPPRSDLRQPVQFTIPIDHPASSTEILDLTCTDSEGFSYSQQIRIRVVVPYARASIVAVDATPERVIAHYALSHAASLDLDLSATCRLYAPGGGLVGTVVQDERLVPMSHEVLDTCQFDLASLQRGDYTLEVVADSPLVSGATSVRKLTADLRITPAASYTSLLHAAFIRTVETGAVAGPVEVQNQGDFRYPQVWFTEQLADAGLQWSASAAIEPHQSVVVLPPAGTIVPYYRNEASYVYCASREVLTDVATDWLVDVPGGFDVLESGITTIATPKITVGVSPQAVDVCASDSLVFDVLVSAGAYGLGGRLPVLAQAEVPSLGWTQTIAVDLSPGSPSASSHHELSLPAGIPAGDHEVRIALLQPDVPAFTGHLVFGDRIYDEKTFTIRPARMEVQLTVAPTAAGDTGTLLIENTGQKAGSYAYQLSLVDTRGSVVLEDAGGGQLDACGDDVPVDFTTPVDLADGQCTLRVLLQTDSQPPKGHAFDLDLSGLQVGLDLVTSQDIYRLADPVLGLGALTNGPAPVAGADLHLEVVRLAASGAEPAPEWPQLGAGPARLFHSTGQGELAEPRLAWQVPMVTNSSQGPALADLDGDGAADAVVADYNDVVAVNGQDGTELWRHACSPTCGTGVPQVADVDGDGGPEVLVLTPTDVICLEGESGALRWQAACRAQHYTSHAATVGAADLDGDGDVEVYHLDRTMEEVCQITPWGTFCSDVAVGLLQVRSGVDGAPLWDTLDAQRIDASLSLAAGDLTGDGALEIVAEKTDTSTVVAFSATGTELWSVSLAACPLIGPPAVADLDADGPAEVVLTCRGESVVVDRFVVLSGADGSTVWEADGGDGAGWTPAPVTVADLNGDGSLEVASSFDGVLTVVDASGQPVWQQTIDEVRGGLVAADLDGDGAMELLALDNLAEWSLKLYDGATGVVEWDSTNFGFDAAGPSNPAVADLDGDGWLEIGLVNVDWVQGLVWLSAIDSASTSGPVGSGTVVEEVLWSTDRNQDLAASQVVALDEDIGLLGTTGQFAYRGGLTSSLGQQLAFDSHPFWIVDGDLLVSISTDRPAYPAGATVQVDGLMSELSGLPTNGLTLRVSEVDAGDLITQSLDLSAYGQQPYDFTMPAGGEGPHDLMAELSMAGSVVSSALTRYEVVPLDVALEFDAPDIVGPEVFDLLARIENRSSLAVDIDVTLNGPQGSESQAVHLDPGQPVELTWTRSIVQDENFEIALTGDWDQAESRLVRFGPSSLIAANPFGAYSADGPVDIPWTLANTGLLEYPYAYELRVLDDADQVMAATSGSAFLALPPDENSLDSLADLWSLSLPEGDYRVAFSSEYGNSGEAAFSVGLPVAAAGVTAEASYPAGLVDIPWSLSNLTSFEAEFAVELALEESGVLVDGRSTSVHLGPQGTIDETRWADWLGNLEPGSYRLTVSGPRVVVPAQADFDVLLPVDVELDVAPVAASCGPKAFDVTVRNAGHLGLHGSLSVRSPLADSTLPIDLDGQASTTVRVELDASTVDPGTHPVEFEVRGGDAILLASASATVQVVGGVCSLTETPDHQEVAVGSQVTFGFGIRNSGDAPATCRLGISAFEEQGPESQSVALEPCAVQDLAFGYLIPEDLDDRDEALAYSLEAVSENSSGSESGFATFHIQGVRLDVTPSLDKCSYRPGDMAALDLLVENTGAVTDVPMTIRVTYPGYSDERIFVLTAAPMSFAYQIPLGDIPTNRIYYEIAFFSGRSAHIDVAWVRGSDSPAWLCTDRDVYDPGDTMLIDYGADEDCSLVITDLDSGWHHEQALLAGEVGTTELIIPAEVRAGTRMLTYGCELATQEHPYVVRGHMVRFVYLLADADFYLPQDLVGLEALVEVEPGHTGPYECVVVPPDGQELLLSDEIVTFDDGYNLLSSSGILDSNQAGGHRVVCRVFADEQKQILLASDSTTIQVGDFELLGVTTDKPSYESGYESAVGTVHLWGFLPEADLTVALDGQQVLATLVSLDGQSSIETPLSVEQIRDLGDHTLSAGLAAQQLLSTKSKAFSTVDTIPPEITIEGVEDGGLYADPVSPVVSVFDMNPHHHTITLDSALWADGLAIGYDGPHVLHVEAVDLAGNRSDKTVSFSLDTSKPVIRVSGVTDGACYSEPVAPDWQATDPGLDAVVATLDGQPWSPGLPVGEGDHLLVVTAVDEAGHVAEQSVSFVVDLNDPQVVINGVMDGQIGQADVAPVVTISDDHLTYDSATLDGVTLEPGTLVTEEGFHTVNGWGFDCAGRSDYASATFSIDRSAPLLDIYFVEDGGCYSPPVFPMFWAFDDNLGAVEALLDGVAFENGGEVNAEGAHLLEVSATDLAGFSTEESASFLLDGTEPILTVSGIQDGAFYAASVQITFAATDDNLTEVSALLDDSIYDSGVEIGADGQHKFVAWALDCAGNQASFSATFVIDQIAPLITVEGIEDGGTYSGPVTPVVTITDDNLAFSQIELDGQPFESGTEVADDGGHVLWAYAEDLAGNSSQVEIAFTISTRPEFRFAICSFEDVILKNNFHIRGLDPDTGAPIDSGHVAAHNDVNMVNNAQVYGDVVAGGDISMRNNTDIFGDVYLGGTLTTKHVAKVHGQVIELGSPATPCDCGYDLYGVLDHRSQVNDNQILLADTKIGPMIHDGVLLVEHNDSVILPGGVFYFDAVILRNNARLSVVPGAQVELYVAHHFEILNNADLVNDPARAQDLLVVAGTNTDLGDRLRIQNNSDLGLMLYAPKADFVYENNVDLYGGLVIRRFVGENNGRLWIEWLETTVEPDLTCQ